MTPLIMLTVLLATGSNEAKKLHDGKGLAISPVLGGFLLGAFLFVISDVNARLGRAFCILVIVSSLLINGTALFAAITPKTKAASTASSVIGRGKAGAVPKS